MPPSSPITVEDSGGVRIIAIHSVGAQTIVPEQLHAALSRLLDPAPAPARFVLDLQEIDGAGSRLIAVIMQFNMHVLKRKGQIRICGLRPHMKEVFDLTRLNTILSIFPSRHEALQGY